MSKRAIKFDLDSLSNQDARQSKSLSSSSTKRRTTLLGEDVANNKQPKKTLRQSRRMSLSKNLDNRQSNYESEFDEEELSFGDDTEDGFDIEQGLTQENLTELHKIFIEMDKDGSGGIDQDEFRLAIQKLRELTGHDIKDNEIDETFMKIDANCDEQVDWQEYLTYVLTSMKEKESMANLYKETTLPKMAKPVQKMHRYQKTLDVCVAILWLPTLRRDNVDNAVFYRTINYKFGKYLTVSRDGIVNIWSRTLSHEKKFELDSVRTKVWVTDACLLMNINALALSTTNDVIIIYELMSFQMVKTKSVNYLERTVTIDTEICPTCLTYWFDDRQPWHAILFWGNMKGNICAMEFNHCKKLCIIQQTHKSIDGTNKGSYLERRINFKELLRNPSLYCGANATQLTNVHTDFVLKLKYYPSKEMFISCASTSKTALYMGDIRQLCQTRFWVRRGVTTFDYCHKNNMVVTAGQDCTVRIWDPYIPQKPIMYLVGHKNPVISVVVDDKRDELITVSKEKDVLIFDLTTQMCSQTITRGNVMLGKQPVTAVCFNPHRKSLVIGNNHLSILEHTTTKEEEKTLITHYKPFSVVIYNALFNNVVAGGIDGYVYVYNLDSGERILQYCAHRTEVYGHDEGLEITAMVFDYSGRRLFTAGRDGIVKCWNFNNGMLLRELTESKGHEVMTIVSSSRKKVWTAGWNRLLIEYDDTIEGSVEANSTIIYDKRHEDDIQAASVNPNIGRLATGSYDGDIYLWNTETYQPLMKLNAHQSIKPYLSIYKQKSKKKQPVFMSLHDKQRLKKIKMLTSIYHPSKLPSISMETVSENLESGYNSYDLTRRRMTEVLQETNLVLNKYIENQDYAIYRLVFLQYRQSTPKTATLVAGGAKGWIRFWSVKANGGLLGQFNAAHLTGDSILNMVTDKFNFFLITCDTSGYIKVWDIADYFMEFDEKYKKRIKLLRSQYKTAFPLINMPQFIINRILVQNKHVPPPKCTLPQLTWIAPNILSSFRAHLQPVHSIDYVNDKQIIISSSLDRSIRLFSLTGQFLGVLGNKCKSAPLFINMFEDLGEAEKIVIKRIKYAPPADVIREASPITMYVYKRGYSLNWIKVKNSVLTMKKSKKHNKFAKTMGVSEFVAKFKRMRMRFVQRKYGLYGLCGTDIFERVRRIAPSLGVALHPLDSNILGKSYKKVRYYKDLENKSFNINYWGSHSSVYNNLETVPINHDVVVPKKPEILTDEDRWMQQILDFDKKVKNNLDDKKSKKDKKYKMVIDFETRKPEGNCSTCLPKLPPIYNSSKK